MGIIINGQNDTIGPVDDDMTLLGTVSIGGTMTIEDFTNIDSVGLITARNGLHVTSGNVAIGHNNPSHELDIESVSPTIELKDSDNNYKFQLTQSGSATYVDFDADGGGSSSLRIRNAYDEKLRVNSNGYVGIGTDNPGAITHIDSVTSNTPLVVEASQNNRSRIVFRNNVETGTECNIELFDDDLRFVTNSGERLRITSDGDVKIKSFGNASNASADALQIGKTDNNYGITILSATNAQGRIDFTDTEDTNDPQGKIAYYHDTNSLQFFTNGATASDERLRIKSNGDVTITDGNLVVASGHGIDFSATSDGGTSTPSELLDDYEEGSWDPQILGWNGNYSIQEGRYIKIGRKVHIIGEVRTDANAGNSFTNAWPGLSNMPFVNTTSFQGVSGSQRHMGTATIIGDVSPSGTNGIAFVTFDRNTGNNAFFPNHISSAGAQNFQNTMINNPTTVDFGYRFNCTYYTD